MRQPVKPVLRYQGARNKQITTVNGADIFSTVTPIDAQSMRFNWRPFN